MDNLDLYNPSLIDLVNKGDEDETPVIKVKVNHGSNKGYKNRKKNKYLKDKKRADAIKYGGFYTRAGTITEKGYIKLPKSSKEKVDLKKLTNSKARLKNLVINEDDAAHIDKNKMVDINW